MALPATWLPPDTSALLSEGFNIACTLEQIRRRLAAVQKTLTDNEFVASDLVDEEGYKITKAQLQQLLDFRDALEDLMENAAPATGFWGPMIGKMVRVLVS